MAANLKRKEEGSIMKVFACFAFLLFALSSCEVNKLISVTVIDKQTKQPLDSVFVEVKAGKDGNYNKSTARGYTNAKGKFETHLMIGCANGCYDVYTEYTKSSYTKTVELNKTEATVEMKRQ